MKRLSVDDYFMTMALIAGARSTCQRRSVGCVILDENNHVMATGYNGTPRGMSHCLDHPCPGVGLPSGEGLDVCQATHAELNALIQCRNTMAIRRLYTTAKPCVQCIKSIMNTGCDEIVFYEDYPSSYKLREGLLMRQHTSDLVRSFHMQLNRIRNMT